MLIAFTNPILMIIFTHLSARNGPTWSQDCWKFRLLSDVGLTNVLNLILLTEGFISQCEKQDEILW